jgi:hypothetical protein
VQRFEEIDADVTDAGVSLVSGTHRGNYICFG